MLKSVQKKKKNHIEINENWNTEIHLHVKRKIFSIHFFLND